MTDPHRTSPDAAPLTRRERVSLDLVARGLITAEGAEQLGISASTFAKFLAGARVKLGVARTTEAIAICVARGEIGPSANGIPDPVDSGVITDPAAIRAAEDLVNDLQTCQSFREAWSVLCAHAARIGASSVQFGLIAEPKGQMTNGARMVAMSLPGELVNLYRDAGGIDSDPIAGWMAGGGGFLALQTDCVPKPFREGFSPSMANFADAVVDHDYRCIVGSVLQDAVTGASFAMPFGFKAAEAEDALRQQDHYRLMQHALSAVFWHFIQSRAILRELVPLSPQMREALQDAARGIAAAESAARMGISVRAVEKLLAEARAVFAAPTTAAAIYRATVYRALI